jgi:hypothetical protein
MNEYFVVASSGAASISTVALIKFIQQFAEIYDIKIRSLLPLESMADLWFVLLWELHMSRNLEFPKFI